MRINTIVGFILSSLLKTRSTRFLLSATSLLACELSFSAQYGVTVKELNNNKNTVYSTNSFVPYTQSSLSVNSLAVMPINLTNTLSTKNIDINFSDYPLRFQNNSITHFAYGGNNNSERVSGDYEGNINITTSGGYAKVLLGGNYGNAGGSSFTGNTKITVTSDRFVNIAGASYLTHDVDSQFNGSTSVIINELLDYTNTRAYQHSEFAGGIVAGGYLGGLYTGSSTGTPTNNVIAGNTQVTVDLSGKSGQFKKIVLGGSALYGGVDASTSGTSSVVITNAESVTFTGFVAGAGFSYSKSGNSTTSENTGNNKSDLTVADVYLNIDSGTFLSDVVGGGFSASGGDIITGNIYTTITGGTFQNDIIGASAVGNTISETDGSQTDFTVGKVVTQDVFLSISNVDTQKNIVGGHMVGGPDNYDSLGSSSVGDITITIGGYDESNKALGGTYNDIYAGSAIVSGSSAEFTQGHMTINLETGQMQSDARIIAAGHVSNGTTKLITESTSVKIGQDMQFLSNVTVSGGYSPSTEQGTNTAIINGNKLLHFDDDSYSNLGETHFYRFDEVKVDQSTAHVQLEGKTTVATLDSEYLTKSGAGSLSVEAGAGRSDVDVTAGHITITTDQANSTLGNINIQSGASASTDLLTISNNETAAAGLSVNNVTGSGTLISRQIEVKQDWQQSQLHVQASEEFRMTSATDVHLQSLSTERILMDNSNHLHVEGVLKASYIKLDEYLSTPTSTSTPYITASDMISGAGDFTFDISTETFNSMLIQNGLQPYLLADLSIEALATADEKSFVFQIDGVGTSDTLVYDSVKFTLGVINEDIYIFTDQGFNNVPEPGTATISLVMLSGMLLRRRRRK